MSRVEQAFKDFNQSWQNLNRFEPDNIEALLIRKTELEDWFVSHIDSPDELMMRDEYRRVCGLIEQNKVPANE